MQHTMRSAFKRWLVLHNEEWRNTGYIRIPHWFRYYIRRNTFWRFVYDNLYDYKGHYSFYIGDDELIELQRPEWIK